MRSNPRLFAAMLPLILLGGCSIYNTAPEYWLPTARQAPMDVYGSWLDVELGDTDPPRRVLGELLCAGNDTLWVLAWNGPQALPTSSILAGRVYHYDPQNWKVALFCVGGILCTPPLNGAFSVLSIPAWWITGAAVADWQYRLASDPLPGVAWTELADHARFPRGFPRGLDVKGLQPRELLGPEPTRGKHYGQKRKPPREPVLKRVPSDF